MQNENLSKILNSADKKAEQATGVLSKLFRQVLIDMKMNQYLWQRLMQRYLRDPRNRIPNNSKEMSSARGNLVKELVRPDMTWKVFRKALNFLNPRRVRIVLHFEWHDGRETTAEVEIHTSDRSTAMADQTIPLQQSLSDLIPSSIPHVTLSKVHEAIKAQQEQPNNDNL